MKEKRKMRDQRERETKKREKAKRERQKRERQRETNQGERHKPKLPPLSLHIFDAKLHPLTYFLHQYPA